MKRKPTSPLDKLKMKVSKLKLELEEAHSTLRAIQAGEVDALIVNGGEGLRVFTLKGAEHPYRVLVETMNEGAATLNSNGLIFYCNQRFADVLEAPLEKIIGSSIYEYLSSEQKERFATSLIASTSANLQSTFSVTTKRGRPLPALLSMSPVEVDGQPGVCVIVTDLTEQKKYDQAQAEVERLKLQAQLFHSAKLASIGTMAAGIAHEINNPLAIMRLNSGVLSERLRKKDPDDLETQKMLARHEIAVDRIAKIVEGLRTFARPDSDRVEEVDLHKVVADTLALCECIFNKDNVTITQDLRSHNRYFQGISGKMKQVVLNLISNAKDSFAGRNGGRIAIETFDSEGMVNLRISDNGCGIENDKLMHIFDPFFTTKSPGQGTGLGLSISHSIVKAAGGTIEVESTVGTGTSFTIRLPSKVTRMEGDPASERAATHLQLKGTALVVDDEPHIREIVRLHLEEFGLAVAEAEDGDIALVRLKQIAFDYVITDLRMLRMSGEDLLAKSRRIPHLSNTRFLVMTGGIVEEYPREKREILEKHAHGMLSKPFDKEGLAAALKALRKN